MTVCIVTIRIVKLIFNAHLIGKQKLSLLENCGKYQIIRVFEITMEYHFYSSISVQLLLNDTVY